MIKVPGDPANRAPKEQSMKKHMIYLMGVSALALATAFAPLSLAQNALAASSTGMAAATTEQTFSYVVQPGNSLSTLAKTYGTTVSAILALNPQITNPNFIYSGEVLLIPVGLGTSPIVPVTSSVASAFITPSTGPQGTYVQVVVSGFPASTPIQVGLHKLNQKLIESKANATTDAYGSATVTMRIPTGSNPNNNLDWVAQVSTTSGKSLAVSSNEFVVSSTITPVYTGEFTYLVRPGDTLSILAREYGTSVSAILALNPQITNPSYIYPGETLAIPTGLVTNPSVPVISSQPSAFIAPSSGPQGTYIEVVVSGFPANTPIQVGLHKLNQKLIESKANATTDAYGSATVTMRIPTGSNANNNLAWLAQVSTTSGTSVTVSSNEFVISTSTTVSTGEFTYLVRPGDTLSILAREYGTSVSAILALNPEITNPSYIYPGETLVIPAGQVTNPIVPVISSQPVALITPSSGPQGTYIQVRVGGFPANTSIEIGLHKYDRTLIESHTNATTDAYGQAFVTMRIPTGSNVSNNREWLAQVTTTSGKSLTVTSNPFYVTGY